MNWYQRIVLAFKPYKTREFLAKLNFFNVNAKDMSRGKGSHIIADNPATNKSVSVSVKGSGDDIPAGTAQSIVSDLEIDVAAFEYLPRNPKRRHLKQLAKRRPDLFAKILPQFPELSPDLAPQQQIEQPEIQQPEIEKKEEVPSYQKEQWWIDQQKRMEEMGVNTSSAKKETYKISMDIFEFLDISLFVNSFLKESASIDPKIEKKVLKEINPKNLPESYNLLKTRYNLTTNLVTKILYKNQVLHKIITKYLKQQNRKNKAPNISQIAKGTGMYEQLVKKIIKELLESGKINSSSYGFGRKMTVSQDVVNAIIKAYDNIVSKNPNPTRGILNYRTVSEEASRILGQPVSQSSVRRYLSYNNRAMPGSNVDLSLNKFMRRFYSTIGKSFPESLILVPESERIQWINNLLDRFMTPQESEEKEYLRNMLTTKVQLRDFLQTRTNPNVSTRDFKQDPEHPSNFLQPDTTASVSVYPETNKINKYVSSVMGLILIGYGPEEAIAKVTQKKPEIADIVRKEVHKHMLMHAAFVENKDKEIKVAQQISRQEVKDVILRWGDTVVMALGYMANPATLKNGYVTKNQNEFISKFGDVVRYSKNQFDALKQATKNMADDQFDRNIPTFVQELNSISNYINQFIDYFGITDIGTNITNFNNIVSKWKTV